MRKGGGSLLLPSQPDPHLLNLRQVTAGLGTAAEALSIAQALVSSLTPR